MSNSATEDGPVQWMQHHVEKWLAAGDPEGAELASWLSGRGLPALGHDDEPYQWILRGIPQGSRRGRVETAIAERAAVLIDRQVDVEIGTGADQRLYNLLMLAAGLGAPDTLADPLKTLLERETVKGRSWRGDDLGDALRAAIIENQLDARYEPVWRSMLAGTTHSILGGTVMSGFDGVLWMPPDRGRRGEPAVEPLGAAFRAAAQYLDSRDSLRPRRRHAFRILLNRAQAAYPRRDWPERLLEMAHQNDWPSWAIPSLPKLAFIVRTMAKGECEFALWKHLTAFIGEYPPAVRFMCGEEVLLLQIPQSRAEEISKAVRRAEDVRCQTELPSTAAVLNAMMEVLLEEQTTLEEWVQVPAWSYDGLKMKIKGHDPKGRLLQVRDGHHNMIDTIGRVRNSPLGSSLHGERRPPDSSRPSSS